MTAQAGTNHGNHIKHEHTLKHANNPLFIQDVEIEAHLSQHTPTLSDRFTQGMTDVKHEMQIHLKFIIGTEISHKKYRIFTFAGIVLAVMTIGLLFSPCAKKAWKCNVTNALFQL